MARIAHILGILLMKRYSTDIFLSNYFNLQWVHFEFYYIYIVSFSNFNLQKRSESFYLISTISY